MICVVYDASESQDYLLVKECSVTVLGRGFLFEQVPRGCTVYMYDEI